MREAVESRWYSVLLLLSPWGLLQSTPSLEGDGGAFLAAFMEDERRSKEFFHPPLDEEPEDSSRLRGEAGGLVLFSSSMSCCCLPFAPSLKLSSKLSRSRPFGLPATGFVSTTASANGGSVVVDVDTSVLVAGVMVVSGRFREDCRDGIEGRKEGRNEKEHKKGV
jgi:hypothetical protein